MIGMYFGKATYRIPLPVKRLVWKLCAKIRQSAHFTWKNQAASDIILQIFQKGVDFSGRYGMITGHEIAGDGVSCWQLHFVP